VGSEGADDGNRAGGSEMVIIVIERRRAQIVIKFRAQKFGESCGT